MAEINSRKFDAVKVQFSEDDKATHYLFYRKHIGKEDDLNRPSDRTLFVANVPPYCNESCLLRLFGSYGEIREIHRQETDSLIAKDSGKSHEKSPGVDQVYSVAFIIFSNFKNLEGAIAKLRDVDLLKADASTYKTGLAKWCSAYAANRPNPERMQKAVDTFMKKYDEDKQKEEELAKEQEGVPDEEGWITVSKKTKKKVVQRTEKKQQWLKAKEAKKNKQKQHLNFYTFQIKQSKRDHIADLRKKFEEDKKKIAAMKATRRFKPY